jgi:LmbE family N-acetylglucosaminyl deacetylase
MHRFLLVVCSSLALLTAGAVSLFAENGGNARVIMCLSAHPDDEDGPTLAYYARVKGEKAYSLFFTRGEGGQNETGSELYGDLGALRTKETLEAARVLGSEVYFLGYPDFGFSKTAKETFKKWGGEEGVLERLVFCIRALKPDVIITTHDTITTKPNRQHGNHQAVGVLAYEAFAKAADPAFHPEQLPLTKGVWQVKKLFFRVRSRDSVALREAPVVEIDPSARDSAGETVADLALAALQKHRSQGLDKLTRAQVPDFFRPRRFIMVRGSEQFPFDAHDLFSGITAAPREERGPLEFPPFPSPLPPDTAHRPVQASVAPKAFVGLIRTYDDTHEETLKSFGVPYALIDSVQLAAGDLGRYSVILLDLRAYAYRADAVAHNDRLLDYARKGGNLVCFYHKTGDWNGKNFSPYPLLLTNERVTEEEAPVTILLPGHRLLNEPNHVGPGDWEGWVQERNIYLPSGDTLETSPKFDRLLSMSDEGEAQPPTSLLWAPCGSGSYTYVSLALYRQLRIRQPGAVRLFLNLVSQPRH